MIEKFATGRNPDSRTGDLYFNATDSRGGRIIEGNILDKAITSDKIADGAITTWKMDENSNFVAKAFNASPVDGYGGYVSGQDIIGYKTIGFGSIASEPKFTKEDSGVSFNSTITFTDSTTATVQTSIDSNGVGVSSAGGGSKMTYDGFTTAGDIDAAGTVRASTIEPHGEATAVTVNGDLSVNGTILGSVKLKNVQIDGELSGTIKFEETSELTLDIFGSKEKLVFEKVNQYSAGGWKLVFKNEDYPDKDGVLCTRVNGVFTVGDF